MANICVFCASGQTLEQRWFALADEVGGAVAGRGHKVVSGGGRVGMMGALVEGARRAGGHTIGAIPQSLVDREVADVDSDELVITDGMAARKIVMVDRADAFVILPGGLGTLDELFEVWTLATLGVHAKPIVLLDVDGFYHGLLAWLTTLASQRFIRPEGLAMVRVARSVDEALDEVERFV
jgi:uncharacterized protein (TIGR00730 family)